VGSTPPSAGVTPAPSDRKSRNGEDAISLSGSFSCRLLLVSSRAKPRDPGSFSTPADAPPITDHPRCVTLELHSRICVIQSPSTPLRTGAAKNPGSDPLHASGSPSHYGKGLGVGFLQPRIIILHANRIRIPFNINIPAIALLRIDHSRPITLATLARRKMIPALPFRQRRLPLQSPPRTIDRGREKDPTGEQSRRDISEFHQMLIAIIPRACNRLRKEPGFFASL
jgi:hypothetical protein